MARGCRRPRRKRKGEEDKKPRLPLLLLPLISTDQGGQGAIHLHPSPPHLTATTELHGSTWLVPAARWRALAAVGHRGGSRVSYIARLGAASGRSCSRRWTHSALPMRPPVWNLLAPLMLAPSPLVIISPPLSMPSRWEPVRRSGSRWHLLFDQTLMMRWPPCIID